MSFVNVFDIKRIIKLNYKILIFCEYEICLNILFIKIWNSGLFLVEYVKWWKNLNKILIICILNEYYKRILFRCCDYNIYKDI